MKRLALFTLLGLFFNEGYSQLWKYQRIEVWGAVSVLQYFGDIGGSADRNNLYGLKDVNLKSNRPGVSFGGIYRYNERWYFQASNTLGFLAQTDKDSRNSLRNFSFLTIIDELSIQGMYFFIKEDDKNYSFSILATRGGGKRMNQPFSFYAFAGIGGIYSKTTPKDDFVGSVRFTGNKNASISVPIGLGGKFALTPGFAVAMDISARYTFTDYLDGLTTPTSKYKDIYYQINVKVIYRLPRSKRISNPSLN